MAEDIQRQDKQNQPEPPTSNKRIAKNTILLYCRMFVMILIGLYTSRMILQVLGVSDYGVYNAVGGMVMMFTIISSSLSTAVSRYLTFELGKGDIENLKEVFSTSINVQFCLALVILFVGGLVGWWFLNYHMNIPNGRIGAANWVLFCALLSFAIGLISVPYMASITAHERMDVYAYMTILEASLKLAIVFVLYISPIDKLVSYSILLLFVAIIIRLIYGIYCKHKFVECSYQKVKNKSMLKGMTAFAGWTFLGNASWVFNTQGINILINIFFGVTLNAARGIATQIEGLVMQLVNNFMTALNPQITKSYASGDKDNMHQLICRGAKFSFFLMIFIAIPISLETERILSLWLGVIPKYTIIFVRLTFISALCTVLGNTLVTAQLATGKVKRYQITMTLVGLWVFPLTWLAYKLGGSPIWAYIVFITIYFILVFVRLYLVKDLINLSWKKYFFEVIIKSVLVGALSLLPPLFIYNLMPYTIIRFIFVCIISFVSSGFFIYYVGINHNEQLAIRNMFSRLIVRK